MGREIKFRAWDKEQKEMIEWISKYGGAYGSSRLEDYSVDGNDRFSVMQFTGLKDKNGTDIYEGDILLNVNRIYEELIKGPFVIEWGDSHNYCGFMARTLKQEVGDMFLAKNFVNCEIIGNRFEHPQLLKD